MSSATRLVGIKAAAAYIPLRRLQRRAMADALGWFDPALASLGHGERAVANWDEDSVTMAVEAARDCLGRRDRSSLSALYFASTTFPFADRQNAGIAKEALVLDDNIATMDVGGSQRAGISALKAAFDAAAVRADGDVLCLAADRRREKPGSPEEFQNGDCAAALLVSSGDLAAEYVGSHSISTDFIDHYRAEGNPHDYSWEKRWVRDVGYFDILVNAIEKGFQGQGLSPGDIDHLVLGLPDGGAQKQVAKRLGIAEDKLGPDLHATMGYGGTAHPLLALSQVLETVEPDRRIAVVGFGQGVDMVFLRATGKAPDHPRMGVQGWLNRRHADSNYLRHLSFTGELALPTGMRGELDLKASHSALYRDRKTVLSLVGGKCRVTGNVQYPKTEISVAPDAREVGTQDDYPLADLPARVVTCTADHLAVSPDPPSRYGMIEFEGGGRFIADFTDVAEAEPHPGDPVRMMFRIKRVDARGFTQYFWKAAPAYRAGAGRDE